MCSLKRNTHLCMYVPHTYKAHTLYSYIKCTTYSFCNKISNKTCKSSLDFRQEFVALSSQSTGSPGRNYGSPERDHFFFPVEEIYNYIFFIAGRSYLVGNIRIQPVTCIFLL